MELGQEEMWEEIQKEDRIKSSLSSCFRSSPLAMSLVVIFGAPTFYAIVIIVAILPSSCLLPVRCQEAVALSSNMKRTLQLSGQMLSTMAKA